MAAPSFEPADGEKARWRHCYDLALSRAPREEITLHEVMDLLDCTEQMAWQSMWQANEHLRRDGLRTVHSVPRFGWIVDSASDMLEATNTRLRRAGSQVRRGRDQAAAVPRDELSQFERQALDRQTAVLAATEELHKRRVRLPLSSISRQPKEIG